MTNTEPAASSPAIASQFRAVVTGFRELGRIAGIRVFQVALDTSSFPLASATADCPLGTLTATARSGAVLIAPVLAVEQDAHGEHWHTTVKPLQPGTPVLVTVFLG